VLVPIIIMGQMALYEAQKDLSEAPTTSFYRIGNDEGINI